MEASPVRLIDATLREGAQSPRTTFSREQTIEIAERLADAGVDVIECGHPAVSDNERRRLQAILELDHLPPILAHARCCEADIDAVADSGAPWVGLFLGVSKISRLTRVRKSREQLIELVGESVTYAKARGLRVRYSLEDASRTDWESAKAAYSVACDAGADRICFTDSVGLLEPRDAEEWVAEIKRQFPDTPLEIHFHDDRGLALANTLAAVDAGCDWISTSVNGIGERCGITDLIALSANLLFREQRYAGHPENLQQLGHLVGKISRSPADHRRPISGRNAFTHTAKLHIDAMKRDSIAYTWIEPTKVGRSQQLQDQSLSSVNPKKVVGN
jgi:2-isopropylmalate synthase